MTRTNADSEDVPLRFSLFTLLLLITLAAGVFGLTRVVGNIVLVWIAAAEAAGIVVGVVFGLFTRRFVRSLLGACIGSTVTTGFPLFLILLINLGIAQQPIWLAADATGLTIALNIAVFGALGGLVGGAVGSLSGERRSPEEIGVVWGGCTGGLFVLLPFVIGLVVGIANREMNLKELCMGGVIFLSLSMLTGLIGCVAGLAIAAIYRTFDRRRQISPAQRKYASTSFPQDFVGANRDEDVPAPTEGESSEPELHLPQRPLEGIEDESEDR